VVVGLVVCAATVVGGTLLGGGLLLLPFSLLSPFLLAMAARTISMDDLRWLKGGEGNIMQS